MPWSDWKEHHGGFVPAVVKFGVLLQIRIQNRPHEEEVYEIRWIVGESLTTEYFSIAPGSKLDDAWIWNPCPCRFCSLNGNLFITAYRVWSAGEVARRLLSVSEPNMVLDHTSPV